MAIRLTKKRLEAIHHACHVGLAGEEGEGDWEGVAFEDLRAAATWASEELVRRERRKRGKQDAIDAINADTARRRAEQKKS